MQRQLFIHASNRHSSCSCRLDTSHLSNLTGCLVKGPRHKLSDCREYRHILLVARHSRAARLSHCHSNLSLRYPLPHRRYPLHFGRLHHRLRAFSRLPPAWSRLCLRHHCPHHIPPYQGPLAPQDGSSVQALPQVHPQQSVGLPTSPSILTFTQRH